MPHKLNYNLTHLKLGLLTKLLIISAMINGHCQTTKTIYFFPGQGSDSRIFGELTIDSSFSCKFIEYGTPERKITMKDFALQLSRSIDTTRSYVLVGVSLGGMICSELNEILSPEKVIIISSAKNHTELPFRYRFQRIVPLYKIIPPKLIYLGAKFLQPIVEPDRNKRKEVFRSMLSDKRPKYLKRTIGLIMSWDRKTNSKKIIHIHGTKDHTIPFRNVKKPDYKIEKGSHMMTLTRADEISGILNPILKNL